MSIEALQTGLEYARLALAEHDERYQRHPTMESDRKIITDDIRVIETAIQQAEAKTDEPVAWRAKVGDLMFHAASREGLLANLQVQFKAAPNSIEPLYTHPAPSVPEFSHIAKRKLDELQEQGFAITGYAIQRGPVRGFIDGGGFVGWWQGEPDPGVPDKVCGKTCNCAVQCSDVYAVDAERFRTLMRAIPGQIADAICGRPNVPDDDIIEAIDALAASPARKGGE